VKTQTRQSPGAFLIVTSAAPDMLSPPSRNPNNNSVSEKTMHELEKWTWWGSFDFWTGERTEIICSEQFATLTDAKLLLPRGQKKRGLPLADPSS